jgi:hypothetical protein
MRIRVRARSLCAALNLRLGDARRTHVRTNRTACGSQACLQLLAACAEHRLQLRDAVLIFREPASAHGWPTDMCRATPNVGTAQHATLQMRAAQHATL